MVVVVVFVLSDKLEAMYLTDSTLLAQLRWGSRVKNK